jgi:hypothetical protein
MLEWVCKLFIGRILMLLTNVIIMDFPPHNYGSSVLRYASCFEVAHSTPLTGSAEMSTFRSP